LPHSIPLDETVFVGEPVKGHVELLTDHVDGGLGLKNGVEGQDIFVVQTLPYSEFFEENNLCW
jgi:hypothetical protein